jgi:hypothetical protein
MAGQRAVLNCRPDSSIIHRRKVGQPATTVSAFRLTACDRAGSHHDDGIFSHDASASHLLELPIRLESSAIAVGIENRKELWEQARI